MAITDLLLQIANGARILPPSVAAAEVGVPLSFGFLPAFPTSLDILQTGDLTAIWFAKDVRFNDALGVPAGTDLSTYLTDGSKVIGGQPVVDPGLVTSWPLAGSLNNVFTIPRIKNEAPPPPPATDLASGTPGVLGKVTGAVPIPIQVPVSVEVHWSVNKRKKDGTTEPAVPGKDFVAPKGLAAPTLDLTFLALPGELVKDFSSLVRFEISATVEVKALGQSSGAVPVPKPPLPPVSLDVQAILGIPTVVALFRHADYSTDDGGPGSVLLAVPENAVIRSVEQLAPLLDTLRDTIKRLQSFQADALSGNFATFLLGLGTLLDALNGQPKFQFLVGNHGHLDLIKFAESGWRVFPPHLGGSDNANDITSSVIVIGVPSRGVKLWGDFDFRFDLDHKFFVELLTGAGMWASIRNFAVREVSEMTVAPPVGPLGQGTIVNLKKDPAFGDPLNDRISSVQFITAPTP